MGLIIGILIGIVMSAIIGYAAILYWLKDMWR